MTNVTHRVLVSVPTSEEAEEYRKKLLALKPRPWVFILSSSIKEDFDVAIANHHGSYPSDEFFKKVEEEILSVEIEADESGEEEVDPSELN